MGTKTRRMRNFFATLIDKSLLKNWKVVAFIPLMYILYGLASIMPLFGAIYNLQSIIDIGFVIIFLLVFFVALPSSLKTYTRIAILENDKKAWLQLHLLFLTSALIFDILVLLPVSWWLTSQAEPNLRIYPSAWTLLTITLFLYFVNALKEMLGMRTINLSGDSVLGARAFAMLSRTLLQNAKRRGIEYLGNAVKMLDNSLSYEGIRIETLRKTSLILDSFQVLNSEGHYVKLTNLSTGIENSLELENVIDSIDKFLGKRETWHKKISLTENRKSNDILLKTLTLCIAIVTVLAALFSESLKNQISSLLLAISWQEIFALIFVLAMVVFLSRSITLFLSRSFDPRDLTKLENKEAVLSNKEEKSS